MDNKGNLIAELRKAAGYTQKSLAEALHITDKAISKWERGICRPDSSLLPRLSLLLNADLEVLLGSENRENNWEGMIDLRGYDVDLSQQVYDKPMVYYLLSHYLLLGIKKISVLTDEKNRSVLSQPLFSELGFSFSFQYPIDTNVMLLNRPAFLFGSDLTRHFQLAMTSEAIVRVSPDYGRAPFLFFPSEYISIYQRNPEILYDMSSLRRLGRGMVCIDLDDVDNTLNVSSFVRMYQESSGLLIACLEEISFRKGLISAEDLSRICQNAPYRNKLLQALEIKR